jgi:hypothetical protein
VTVGHRDRLAAGSMLSVATGQDGVLIWGTRHLPGTITSLRVIMQSR